MLTVKVCGVSRQEHKVDKVEATPLYSEVTCAHADEADCNFLFPTTICLDTTAAVARAVNLLAMYFSSLQDKWIGIPSMTGSGVAGALL
jgi:hypothetical protein